MMATPGAQFHALQSPTTTRTPYHGAQRTGVRTVRRRKCTIRSGWEAEAVRFHLPRFGYSISHCSRFTIYRVHGAVCVRCRPLKVRCESTSNPDTCWRCMNGGHECTIPGKKKRRQPP
jgi:hypothetical protein